MKKKTIKSSGPILRTLSGAGTANHGFFLPVYRL